MLVQSTDVRSRLRAIVQNLVKVAALQEDFLQEALIHLWCIEEDQPNMTLSWYLNSCSFHVRHLVGRGHSLDAPKRHYLALPLEPDMADRSGRSEIPDPSPGPFEHSTANDLLQETAIRLTPGDKAILILLTENRGPREIGSLLGISHVAVIKARVRIARVLTELG